MQQLFIPEYGTIKINSFKPLCHKQLGVMAIEKYGFPPFIDASCRREPDFENPFPSITALCRQGKFAPHLRKNNIVVYITTGGTFKPYKLGHHLIAILQVEEVYKTHELGKRGYINANLPIPNNCMVEETRPYKFDQTAGGEMSADILKKYLALSEELRERANAELIKDWDNDYLQRSLTYQCFIKTKSLYTNVQNPIRLLRSDFQYIFGKLPNTRTPNIISESSFIRLGKFIGLDITLGQYKFY